MWSGNFPVTGHMRRRSCDTHEGLGVSSAFVDAAHQWMYLHLPGDAHPRTMCEAFKGAESDVTVDSEGTLGLVIALSSGRAWLFFGTPSRGRFQKFGTDD